MKKKSVKKIMAVMLTLAIMISQTAYGSFAGRMTVKAANKKISVKKPAATKQIKQKKITDHSVTIQWKKVKNADGYQVKVYNTKKQQIKSFVTKNNTKKTIKGLSKNTKYTMKVRAYVLFNKKKYYGKYKKISIKTSESKKNVTTENKTVEKETEKKETEQNATTEDSSKQTYENQVLELVNQERAKEGIAPLSTNDMMQKIASIRAKELEEKFSHTRPDGRSCFSIFKENGITYARLGENIALGQKTPKDVMNSWMNSSGHRANILDSQFTQIGIGYYKDASGKTYWVQVFMG